MDKISVKSTELTLRAADNAKSAGKVSSEATDDFRKLLKGQQNDSQEVSKDTKTEKKQEPEKEVKEEPVKNEKKEPVKDEAPAEETEQKSQTASLLAAYQMAQNMKPEVIEVTPEMTEEAVPEMEIAAEAEAEVQMPVNVVQEDVQPAQAEPAIAEKVVETVVKDEVKMDSEKPSETPETEVKQETVPVQKKTDDTGTEDARGDDSHAAEQTAQPQTEQQPVRTAVQEMRPQEPVRVYVPKPEELPQKVTDQLMAKMTEGAQEFEIHIEPANLGKIAVRILYQEGQATVSIMCSEKKTFEMLGRNAGEIGQVIEKNLGGTTTIIVDKQENDYLNQTRDENQKNGQNQEQEQKEGKKNQDAEDSQQFLQKLRLGLMN